MLSAHNHLAAEVIAMRLILARMLAVEAGHRDAAFFEALADSARAGIAKLPRAADDAAAEVAFKETIAARIDDLIGLARAVAQTRTGRGTRSGPAGDPPPPG